MHGHPVKYRLGINLVPAAWFFYRSGNTASVPHFAVALGLLFTGSLLAKIAGPVVFQYWLGIAFSLLFLDLIFKGVTWQGFVAGWKDLDYLFLVPASLLTVLTSILQTARWKVILASLRHFRFSEIYPSVMIGHLSNHVLPAKAGELLKTFHLGTKFGHSKLAVLSTIVIERVFDGVLVLSFLLLFLMALGRMDQQLLLMGVMGAVIYGGALSFLVATVLFRGRVAIFLEWMFPQRLAVPLGKFFASFADGLNMLKDGRQVAKVMGFSVVMWLVNAASIVPLLRMFDFGLPPVAPFAILACIALGLTIPSAPGGVGIVSLAAIFATKVLLDAAGHPVHEGDEVYARIVAFSVLLNVVFVAPEILLGAFFVARDGRNFSAALREVMNQGLRRIR